MGHANASTLIGFLLLRIITYNPIKVPSTKEKPIINYIPAQRDELLRFSFIGFSLVEASGLIGLVMSFVLLFGI